MKLHSTLSSVRRHALIPLLIGATVFQIGGCDPTVRSALLSGFQASLIGLTTAIINAIFMTLQNTVITTQSSVQAVFQQFQAHLS